MTVRDETRGEQAPTEHEREIDRLWKTIGEAGWILSGATLCTYVDGNVVRLATIAREEIDRLRADHRHLREAMMSVRHHAGDASGDKADRLITCLNVATDTLGRVKP